MATTINYRSNVNLDNEARSALSFEKMNPQYLALQPGELLQDNLDEVSTVATVLGAWPQIIALLGRRSSPSRTRPQKSKASTRRA